jgi:hypothetical protein
MRNNPTLPAIAAGRVGTTIKTGDESALALEPYKKLLPHPPVQPPRLDVIVSNSRVFNEGSWESAGSREAVHNVCPILRFDPKC